MAMLIWKGVLQTSSLVTKLHDNRAEVQLQSPKERVNSSSNWYIRKRKHKDKETHAPGSSTSRSACRFRWSWERLVEPYLYSIVNTQYVE
ncbi:hypothetical protein RND71_040339 [Anisodus tanguticus]|uniref:Uncharacterized protein n=1 Tax=Anisodus tanguticus TaxID=243964 RepID=A0AAE1QVE4_9SOLA|nr:hypothetical protein RND71_040339 [Anisodus tanguticus]